MHCHTGIYLLLPGHAGAKDSQKLLKSTCAPIHHKTVSTLGCCRPSVPQVASALGLRNLVEIFAVILFSAGDASHGGSLSIDPLTVDCHHFSSSPWNLPSSPIRLAEYLIL